MNKLFIIILISLFTGKICSGQTYRPDWESLNTRKVPEWFHNDKFGIFIHWGVYAVPSFSRVAPSGYSEWYWSFFNDSTSQNYKAVHEFHNRTYGQNFSYGQFVPMFKAELYNPDEWATIFKKSGAKYVVLTSKHHDGYCLWPSREADQSWGRPWNAVTSGPGRDVLGELTNSVRKAGLRMGYYYSLMEWYNPIFLKNKDRYVNEVLIPQFKDLVTRYKPSVIFSDGEWIMEDTEWKSPEILAWLFNESPVKNEIVINDRWGKTTRKSHPCTYYTSEYGSGMDKSVVWEENRGMGQSYGYNRMEKLADYKTSQELILMLVDIVSRGGNLLLNIGPAADGTIPVIMEDRLSNMGKWLDVNGEAIYGTTVWKHDKQWSEGKRPEISGGNYQTNYDINQLVIPNDKQAFVEMFFTSKGSTIYGIIPSYSPKIIMKDIAAGSGMQVRILGLQKPVKWKVTENAIELDISSLQPGDFPNQTFVVKIINSKN
jgi:alpha-L-fucosidase